MPCIKFERLESGKVKILEEKLNLLRLKEDEHYLVNDYFLDEVKRYSGKVPQGLAYVVVGWTEDKSKGIAAEIGKDRLDETIQKIYEFKKFTVNPKI